LKFISVLPTFHFAHGGVIVWLTFTFGSSERANDVKVCAKALMKSMFWKGGVERDGQ
jgi:hypothetical protein